MAKAVDKIVIKNIDDLIAYENNPRKNDKAVETVANSIQNFGFKIPIVIDSKNVIVCGHTRVKACRKLGISEIPCIVADDLSEDQIKAFRLADNRSSELADWDFDKLKIEFDNIELDLDLFGFEELQKKLGDDPEDDDFDESEALTDHPYSQKGDIYILGNHRLMCGDSTNKDDVKKLMNGNKADMVFTDPPYLMGFTGNVHADGSKSFNAKHGAIKNDKMSREDGDQFILDIFTNIKLFNKGAYYVCFYRLGLDYIFRALDKLENQYKALIIWNKGNHTLSNSDYMSKYEPIVYGWFDSHLFYGDRSNFDIWDIQRTQKNGLHPTMKPIALCCKAIENSSKKEDIVLDLFGGSGSTLIACEQLNRNCFMMELDERYVDVIVKRYLRLVGNYNNCFLIRSGKKEALTNIPDFQNVIVSFDIN